MIDKIYPTFTCKACFPACWQYLKGIQDSDSRSTALVALAGQLKELHSSTSDAAKSVTMIPKESILRKNADMSFGHCETSAGDTRPIWIEWRYISATLSHKDKEILLQRIKALGSMLCSIHEPCLRIPPCLGLLDDIEFYYHPEAVHEFTKLRDLYSLGIVLFEIGSWALVSQRVRDFKKMDLPTLHNFLKGIAVDDLGWRIGAIYRDVVKTLLSSDLPEDDDEALAQAFFLRILRELDTCKA